MSKKEKQFYCNLGQAVCNVAGAIIFIAVPMIATVIADVVLKLILG